MGYMNALESKPGLALIAIAITVSPTLVYDNASLQRHGLI